MKINDKEKLVFQSPLSGLDKIKQIPLDDESLYDIDLTIKENSSPEQPVECSSETCNCKTRACHTYNVGSCHSCGCTNSWGCHAC